VTAALRSTCELGRFSQIYTFAVVAMRRPTACTAAVYRRNAVAATPLRHHSPNGIFRLNPATLPQFTAEIARCRALFLLKTADYGTAWRVLRPSSVTDQLFIKARRIRSIEEKGTQRVAESVEGEFIALVNYAIIGLMQLELTDADANDLPPAAVEAAYDRHVAENLRLLDAKNHDYDEAWREMRISSLTDLILMKLYRTRQIEDQGGAVRVSEGVDANYRDILNYAVFALIRLGEG
jgi:hypothetical protein